MSLLLEDDTRYVKLWLLLKKGGTYVFKKHTQRILDNDNTTIDVCLEKHRDKLSKVKKIYPKLWELLCSNSKDIDVLDISAHAYVLLNLFGKKLNAVEKVNLTKLRDKRNELGHLGDGRLPEKDFLGEWSRLIKVLYQLYSGLTSNDQDHVDKLIDDISAMQHLDKAIDELRPFENQDDIVKDVLAKLHYSNERRFEELTQRMCELEKQDKEKNQSVLEELTQRICELEKRNKEKDQSGMDELNQLNCELKELKRNPEREISARITVSSSTQTACDAAHHNLLEASKRCLTGGHVNQEEDEVFTACNNMFTDMSNDGASIKTVEEGSVLITFSCSTLTSLKSAFLYLTKTVYIQRLQELEKALSQSVGCCVKLNVNIILESLISTLDKEENCTSDKSVVLTVSCMGSKGVRSVCNSLVNESSTNTVNNVAEALSTSVGQRIELHTSIDLDKLENEISLLERLHGYHDVQRSLSDGQCEIKNTQSDLKEDQSGIKQTQSDLKEGQSGIKQTQSELKDGQSEIIHTRSELKDGQSEIKHTQSELKEGQTEIKHTQSELKEGQTEIKHTQSELKDGQSEIIHTRSELKDGQSEIKHTQSQLKEGQTEIKHTQSELKDIQSKLRLSLKNFQKKQKDQTKVTKSVQDLQQQTKRRLYDSEQPFNATKRIKSCTNYDVLVFRYQYLLIEVGTHLLRKLFNNKVSNDFMQYLKTNKKAAKQFQFLLGSDVITDHQKNFLPPLDNSPDTENFDITLLVCFLRNICGLKQYKDPVWKCPDIRDRTVEAEITRLKECRNFVVHTGTVYISESDLKQKLSELSQILQRLNFYCGVTNLSEMIEDANNKPLDDQLKQQYDNILKAWHEAESLFEKGIDQIKISQSKIKQTQSELKAGQSEIKQTQSELKDDQSKLRQSLKNVHKKRKDQTKLLKSVQDLQQQTKRRLDNSEQSCNTTKRVKSFTNDDIQKELIDTYQNDICSSLPLCPLLEDEKGGLLELYEVPTMYVVNYYKVEKQLTDKSSDGSEEVKTCSDLFHVKDKDCKNIYLTGDAGVGKTSFCKFLSLLWCKSKLGKKLEKVDMQEYIDYLDRFEFVFYVNLRDTGSTDLKAIVVNQLLYRENKDSSNRMYDIVEDILGNHDSLVIIDGLDEWTPVPTDPTDKRRHEIPVRPKSLKCVYLTTCRPYKIENVRLCETNLDHQVKMTGLGYTKTYAYVSNLINIINTKYDENKNYEEFMMAVREVNLLDMLHIPMTTSHLVMLWFDRPLTSMTKTLIYGNIMDMLFKLAHKKGIVIQQSQPSKLKLPDRLSELKHFKDHFSQIEQLCLLSFKLLFEHDTDITSLVFTRDQLASEPYCLSEEETNFFCTIGILSKNKVKRKFGKQEHKLSFLHKSYLEFFAAVYVSTFDTSDVLEVFSQCRTINDVLKYENFLIFYAGLSIDNLLSLMTRIYSLISKDLDLTRVKSIFSAPDDTIDKKDQLISLQDLILKCNIEGSYQIENSLPLEDFIFEMFYITNTKTKYLRKLILSNINNVRLLRLGTGEYFDEFDHITSLTGLCINKYHKCFRKFNKLIKQNKSSLQMISIEHSWDTPPSLRLDDFHYLTSLSLEDIVMSHEDLQYLTKFLSNNSQLKHLELKLIRCTAHGFCGKDVCGSFELLQCNKLVYLHISSTNIVCNNINSSSLEYIILFPHCESIARSYLNILNSIQYALELKYQDIHLGFRLDDHLVETLITNVQYLSKIETIKLYSITIRDNVSFLLHPSVQQVSIILSAVNMTARWFQTFIESVINKHCCIKFDMVHCIIRQDNGDTEGSMSEKDSLDYIYDYIKSIPAIKIVGYYSSNMSSRIEFVINDKQ